MPVDNLLRARVHVSFFIYFSWYLYILKRKFHSFAIVYFCLGRFISPIVGELSKKYPNVTTYKIDIDQVWNIIVSMMYILEF